MQSDADCGSMKENESRLLPSADEILVGESSMGAMGLKMPLPVVSMDSGKRLSGDRLSGLRSFIEGDLRSPPGVWAFILRVLNFKKKKRGFFNVF